jgi:hypothetical protein
MISEEHVVLVGDSWIVGGDVEVESIFGGACWGEQIVG